MFFLKHLLQSHWPVIKVKTFTWQAYYRALKLFFWNITYWHGEKILSFFYHSTNENWIWFIAFLYKKWFFIKILNIICQFLTFQEWLSSSIQAGIVQAHVSSIIVCLLLLKKTGTALSKTVNNLIHFQPQPCLKWIMILCIYLLS